MSRKSGPPVRELPPIPAPKVRSKARYSLVVINETGRSLQIEMTPWRVRAAVAVVVGVLAVVGVIGAKGILSRSGSAAKIEPDQTLSATIQNLQQELRQKELVLSVQEKRLKELQEQPTLAAAQPRQSLENPPSPSRQANTDAVPESDGPLLSLQEPARTEAGHSKTARRSQEAIEPVEPEPLAPKASDQYPSPSKAPVINFNAQRVTAVANTPNSGMLSFQLVKDQPDIRFSGYLFVFVEMADGQETKLTAYPERARFGEEDLPSDFRDGESVTFKQNSRAELPYKDKRPDASLSRVSILLYGQNGKIVFQRGFDSREIKILNAKNGGSDKGRAKAGEKRRAL